MSALGYCPIIWMFCGKSFNDGMEKVQKMSLRIIYNDFESNFDTLLNKGGHLKLHEINKRRLLVEVYKCLNQTNPVFLNDLFTKKYVRFNLRSIQLLKINTPSTLTYGLKSLVYRGSRMWNDLDNNIKIAENLNKFKSLLKKQGVIKCTCHICE